MNDPAVLFYTSDFLTGITSLTNDEIGQYIKLLCIQHQTGHLSEKTIKLSVGIVSEDVLSKFIKDENGLYYNERMDIEINKRNEFVNSRKRNGSLGGRPIKNKPSGLASGKPLAKPNGKAKNNLGDNDNDNDNKDINELILIFEKYFDKNYCKKSTAEKLLKNYQLSEIIQVIDNAKSDTFWSINFLSPNKLLTKDSSGVLYYDKFKALKKVDIKPQTKSFENDLNSLRVNPYPTYANNK